MKKKKIIGLTASLLLAFTVSACGPTNGGNSGGNDPSSQEGANEKELKEIREIIDRLKFDPHISFEYDGTPKSIIIEEASEVEKRGVTVTYEGNGKIDAGEYPVSASFTYTKDPSVTFPKKTGTLVIHKRNFSFDGVDVLKSEMFVYDGKPHSLEIDTTDFPAGVTVVYTNNNQTEPGSYLVTARLDGGNNYQVGETVYEAYMYILDKAPSEGLEYSILNEGYANEAYMVTSIGECISKDIVIPPLHNERPVVMIDNGAFAGKEFIESVTMYDNITYIGERAFQGCINLVEAKLPKNVKYLDCFYSCSSLKRIEIPEGAEIIGGFGGCTSLETVVLPDSLKTISFLAFYGCINLQTINLPEGLETIGSYAFSDCRKLFQLSLGESLQEVGEEWYGPNLVEIINHSNLTKAELGLGDDIYVINSEEESLLKIDENGFAIYDDKILVGYVGDSYTLLIPNGIERIRKNALYTEFENRKGFIAAEIPETVTVIDDWAFNNLIEIANKSSVEITMGGHYIHEGNMKMEIVGGLAFYETTLVKYIDGDTNVVIPDSVAEIGSRAFQNTEIETVKFGSGVIEIGIHAFEGCKNLYRVQLNDNLQIIGENAFSDCTLLSSISIPNSVKKIYNAAFSNCGLTSLNIPDSVETIESIVYDCKHLTSFTIGSHIYIFHEYDITNCPLTSLLIPFNVQKIEAAYWEEEQDVLFNNNEQLNSIFYAGGYIDWLNTLNGNTLRDGITVYFYSENTPPSDQHHYWHYVNDVPTAW